jgi:cell division protein FtsB
VNGETSVSAKQEVEHVSGRVKFTARAVILGVIVMLIGFAFIDPVRAYLAERAHISQLERQVHSLQVENTALEQRTKQLQDPAYLERLARECLGMIEPGDIAFVSVPKGSKTGSPSC